MSRILFVGNIPYGVAEEYIKELLCRIGPVISMRFLTDRHSFHTKWFGFVEMDSEEEAKKAMEALNDKTLLKGYLTVLKNINKMPENKLCSFCISKKTCNKPEAERQNNCKDYMLRIEKENELDE